MSLFFNIIAENIDAFVSSWHLTTIMRKWEGPRVFASAFCKGSSCINWNQFSYEHQFSPLSVLQYLWLGQMMSGTWRSVQVAVYRASSDTSLHCKWMQFHVETWQVVSRMHAKWKVVVNFAVMGKCDQLSSITVPPLLPSSITSCR